MTSVDEEENKTTTNAAAPKTASGDGRRAADEDTTSAGTASTSPGGATPRRRKKGPGEDDGRDLSSGPRFGQRHLLVVLAHIGTGLVYCMRVSLSVALVAMVNATALEQPSAPSDLTGNDTTAWPADDIEAGGCNPPPIFADSESPSAGGAGGEFAWPRELQGLILSSFFWGYIVTTMPSGLLTQRFSCKWLFGLGTLWTAVLTLLTPAAAHTSVYLLIALRVLVGVGEGVTLPAILSMLGRWAPPREKAFLYALVSSATLGGTVVGQMLAGPMCRAEWLGGWPSVFYIFGGISVLWIVPWAICTNDYPEAHPWIGRAERRYIMRGIGLRSSTSDASGSFGVIKRPEAVPWGRLLTDPAVWAFAVCALSHAWIFYTFLNCLPQFLADVLDFNISANGIVSSLPYLSGFPSALLCAYASDRAIEACGPRSANPVRKLFNLVAYLGQAGCLLGVVFVECDAWAAIGLLVAAFCLDGAVHGGYHPNALDHAPLYAGIIHGISNTLSTAAGIVAPAATDIIARYGTAEEWAVVFYIAAVMAVLGGVSFTVFGSAEQAEWAAIMPHESYETTSVSSASGDSGVSGSVGPRRLEKSLLRSVEALTPDRYAYVEMPTRRFSIQEEESSDMC